MTKSKTLSTVLSIVVLTLGAACSSTSKNHVLRTHWNNLYPSTSHGMNLQGAVKSIRVQSYHPKQSGATYSKGEVKQMEFLYYAYQSSYGIQFNESGQINHYIVYAEGNKEWLRRSYLFSSKGQWLGTLDYNKIKRSRGKMTVSYENGKLSQVDSETTMETDNWTATFSYPTNDTIAYSVSFYEMGSTSKEYIEDNLVRQRWTKEAGAGDITTKHHVYDYDTRGNLIEDKITIKTRYPLAPDAPEHVRCIVKTYQYTYDKIGNWISRVDIIDSKAETFLEREIVYY